MNEQEIIRLQELLKKAEELVDLCLDMPVHADVFSFAWLCIEGSILLAKILLFDKPNLCPPSLWDDLQEGKFEPVEIRYMRHKKETGVYASLSPCEETRHTLWGKALERSADLDPAPGFCDSLESWITMDENIPLSTYLKPSEKEEKWRREHKPHEADFRRASIDLSREIRNKILKRLSRYGPGERDLTIRYDVLRAHLKAFRDAFICNAFVRWPCRASEIPQGVRSHSAPDAQTDVSGVLKIQQAQDREQHKCWFSQAGTTLEPPEKADWTIDSLGLKEYKNMLSGIWDTETGKAHSYPSSEPARWIISRDAAKNLEDFAEEISEIALPLKNAAEDHKEYAKYVQSVLRVDNAPWQLRTVSWSFTNNLSKVIKTLEQTQRQYALAKTDDIGRKTKPTKTVGLATDEKKAGIKPDESEADSATGTLTHISPPQVNKSMSQQVGQSHEQRDTRIKEPPKEATQAYNAYYGTGNTQTEVAEIMTKKLKKPVSQGQVSKWITQYKNWRKAEGNPVDDTKPNIIANSNILDMGARTDGRVTGDPAHKKNANYEH